MNNWQVIPEVVGCNWALRMASIHAVDAVEQGRHFVVEGEPGSGRRLLARSAWCRRAPGRRPLLTVDCRMSGRDGAEALLFGTSDHPSAAKLTLARGGALLLLHAEHLHPRVQTRLAQLLSSQVRQARGESVQLLLTTATSLDAAPALAPALLAQLTVIRMPALRERVEDIRAIAEAMLRDASPFRRIRCSQALIERFCAYDWPGNVTELRSVLRRLLLEQHTGLLDVRHLADLMGRDETCFALMQGSYAVAMQRSDFSPTGSLQ